VFVSNHQCIGLGFAEVVSYENQNMVIPSTYIAALMDKKNNSLKKLENLRTTTSQAVSESNSKIKGLRIETDVGIIQIRLFDETPQYRDNFIRLVRENYYDSLLIHRVIKGFGIQSGAADTRYAGPDDVVGWKGPGYTLPAHVVPKFFHKRGMIGSPRKPDRGNSKRRSDGSQFYIVTGRVYSDRELDEIEQESGHQFTAKQRREYKITGGAPHIDGTYSIFGEVVSGMDVADRIVRVETDSDFRPLKDIRVKKITILE
jgi:cyclophilin family peptidyl-prolyl cis-trans isomerase